MATKKNTLTPGIMLVISYFILFTVNALVIILANALFPSHAVLGTIHIPVGWAVLHAVAAITLISTFAIPFINYLEQNRQGSFTPLQWMLFYFFINFAAVWLVTRAAHQFGFGVSSWLVVAVLALVMDLTQGIAMMQLEKARPKS